MIEVPLLGFIAAGEPIQVPDSAFEYETDKIELPRKIVPYDKRVYALKVKGDSMIDAFINDGDIVVMLHTNTANDEDMVAAWLIDRQETTLKRFYREDDQIRLEPENKLYNPITISSDKVLIQGRVINVFRQFKEKKEKDNKSA